MSPLRPKRPESRRLEVCINKVLSPPRRQSACLWRARFRGCQRRVAALVCPAGCARPRCCASSRLDRDYQVAWAASSAGSAGVPGSRCCPGVSVEGDVRAGRAAATAHSRMRSFSARLTHRSTIRRAISLGLRAVWRLAARLCGRSRSSRPRRACRPLDAAAVRTPAVRAVELVTPTGHHLAVTHDDLGSDRPGRSAAGPGPEPARSSAAFRSARRARTRKRRGDRPIRRRLRRVWDRRSPHRRRPAYSGPHTPQPAPLSRGRVEGHGV